MKTPGQKLYEHYFAVALAVGVTVDRWEDIDVFERKIWERFALDLKNRP